VLLEQLLIVADPGTLGHLIPFDFSKRVLQVKPADLAVLPVSGVEWDDLGDPVRVLAMQERTRGSRTLRERRAPRHPRTARAPSQDPGSGGTPA
jgi:hypothetical protein